MNTPHHLCLPVPSNKHPNHNPPHPHTEAKAALRNFLLANEANKAVKAAEKERAAQEDAYYKEAWAAQLDKQDRERRERWVNNGAWVGAWVGPAGCW